MILFMYLGYWICLIMTLSSYNINLFLHKIYQVLLQNLGELNEEINRNATKSY